MPSDDVMSRLLARVRELPPPWNEFSLDRGFDAEIRGQSDYDVHGVIREIIYNRFSEDPSISLGALPPVVSPLFWETVSGRPADDVRSVKDPDRPISPERRERYLRMHRYWQKIPKISLLNPQAYRRSLQRTYDSLRFSPDRRLADIDRRLEGLGLLEAALGRGELPRLLLMIPISSSIEPMDRSFTVTSHMEVELIRGEGSIEHRGRLYYQPEPTPWLQMAWNQRWNLALRYAAGRSDWPSGLIVPASIDLFREQCRQFNLGSVDLLRRLLEQMRELYSRALGPAAKEYDAFLCHASEDKVAVVAQFDEICRARGLRTWFDTNEVAWGDRVMDKINHGLASSRYVVVFVSRAALGKAWVREEINAALHLGVREESFVLPVALGLEPGELAQLHPVLGARNYKSLPGYDPEVPVPREELERLADALVKRLGGA